MSAGVPSSRGVCEPCRRDAHEFCAAPVACRCACNGPRDEDGTRLTETRSTAAPALRCLVPAEPGPVAGSYRCSACGRGFATHPGRAVHIGHAHRKRVR